MRAYALEILGLVRSRLARDAAASLLLMLGNALLMFLANLLLARLLGVDEYGLYTYVLIWLNLLAIPALLGLDRLLVREVSIYRTKLEWDLLSSLVHWANRLGVITSLGLAILVLSLVWAIQGLTGQPVFKAFAIGIWSLPFMTLSAIRRSILRGFDKIVSGQLPEMLVRPLLLILLVSLPALYWQAHLNSTWVLFGLVTANGLTFLFGDWQLRQVTARLTRSGRPAYRTREWLASALPLMFTIALGALNEQTSAVLLGILKTHGEVGVFGVANYLARTLAFVLMAANTALAPAIASLYAAGERERLQAMVSQSVRAVLAVTTPLAIGLLLTGGHILVIFGPGFEAGEMPLVILCLGQVVNCALGPVGLLLLMTGHERVVVQVMAQAFVLNVILGGIMIPPLGASGAALAATASLVFWNIRLTRQVHRQLGISLSLWPAINKTFRRQTGDER